MAKEKTKRDFFLFEIFMSVAIMLLIAAVIYPYSLFIRGKSRTTAIETQLVRFGMSARAYMRDVGLRRIKYPTALRENVHKPLVSYWGESYDDLIFEVNGGKLTVVTKSGKEISVEY